ncbi:MAG: glycosyltransferase family 1 protein [Chitinophagaceae bacterium]|nr:MAG: glycosyltransferase family 1 protein [Chitinophagaceae bacterium]
MSKIQVNTLHIIDNLWLGGAQTVVKGIFEKYSQNENFHLFVLRDTDEKMSVENKNVTVYHSSSRFHFRATIRQIQKIIKKENIELLHCHLPRSQYTGIIIKLIHKKIKLVFHEQGDVIDPFPLNLPAYKFFGNLIEHVICCSDFVKNTLEKKSRFPGEKISVLYNFVDRDVFTASDRVPGKKINIGFAGRLTQHKGWRDFLEATAKLSQKRPNICIHIAGTGKDKRKMLDTAKSLFPDSQFMYHGFVKKMDDFYREMDFICMPSHREPVGMVHIEAMASGKIVIASDVPGMNELLIHNKNAYLFEAGNINDLQIKLSKALDNSEKNSFLLKNAEKLLTKVSFSAFDENLQKIYQNKILAPDN